MSNEHPLEERLLEAYENMVERMLAALEAGKDGVKTLNEAIKHAGETAVELDELSHDEVEKVSYYLKRDIEDAGKSMESQGHELADWLHMDMELIEHKLFDLFSSAGNPTLLAHLKLGLEARSKQE